MKYISTVAKFIIAAGPRHVLLMQDRGNGFFEVIAAHPNDPNGFWPVAIHLIEEVMATYPLADFRFLN